MQHGDVVLVDVLPGNLFEMMNPQCHFGAHFWVASICWYSIGSHEAGFCAKISRPLPLNVQAESHIP